MRWPARLTAAVTPAGWAILLVVVVGFAIGLGFGWREPIVVAAGAAFLVAIALSWAVGRLSLEIDRRLDSDRVAVGDRVVAHLLARNPGRTPIGRRLAFDQVGPHRVPVRLPRLAPHAEHVSSYVVPTSNRGRYSLGPVRVVRSDPFGMFIRERSVGEAQTLWITPRVHPIAANARSWTSDLDGPTHDSSPLGGNVFHTLREYQRGDDVRHIHWRSTARTNQLVVRQFVDSRRPSMFALLDNRRAAYADEAQYELAIEVMASLAMSAVRSKRPLIALTNGADLGGGRAAALGEGLLEQFCQITPVDDPLTAVQELARSVRQSATEAVLVTGAPEAEVLSITRLLPTTKPTVVHVEPPAAPGLLIPRCSVVAVSDGEEFVARWHAHVRS